MEDRLRFRAVVNRFGDIRFAYSDYQEKNPQLGDLKLSFVDGNWIVEEYDWAEYEECDELEWVTLYFDEPIKIEQCTALKDKNGNLIWEGDVVEYKIPGIPKISAVVCWSPTSVRFLKGSQDIATYQKSTVVIGNIHKNPELIPKSDLYKY